MNPLIARPLRFGLHSAKRLLMATETGRNLLFDVNNNNEFRTLLIHEKMLGDRVRVDTYREAIRRQVKPGDVVVDLGTGTGVLAMFAAQQGARVYAVDHADIIDLARRIGEQNGYTSIRWVRSNSRDFECPEPVDFVIHEQLGCAMLDENMVENLLDLKHRVLKSGGQILPGRFELFVEPVCQLPGRNTPRIWEQSIEGIDHGFLRDPRERRGLEGDNAEHFITNQSSFSHLLGEPEPVLTLDLNEIDSADEIPREFEITREVVNPGPMHGAVVYFRAYFGHDVVLDTTPFQEPPPWNWEDYHLYRTPTRTFELGETVRYGFRMDSLVDVSRWWVDLREPSVRGEAPSAASSAAPAKEGAH